MRIYTLKNVRKKLLTLSFLTFSSFTYAQYCTPSSADGCGDGDDVNSVVISGENGTSINQNNTGCSSGDYSNMTSLTVNLSQGLSYNANVSSEYNDFGDGDYCAIWIDLNDDQTFQSSEMVGFYDNILSLSGTNVPITIPASAPLGTHRMRITVYYPQDQNGDLMTSSEVDPCNSGDYIYSYGETHDYNVNIVPPPPCLAPSNLSANATDNSISVSWTGTGNFILEYHPSGFTPGTGNTAGGGIIINPATSPQLISGLNSGTFYDIYIRKDCTAASDGFSSNAMLTASTTGPLANDECSGAIEINPQAGSAITAPTQATVTSATASPQAEPSCGSGIEDDVWFKFTATSAQHTISILNADLGNNYYYGLGVSVYSGTCGNLSEMQCEGYAYEDFFGTYVTPIELTSLTIGATYYVRIWTSEYSDEPGTIFSFGITSPTPPSNDAATQAIELNVGATCSGNAYTNESATLGAGEPYASCHDASEGEHSVWFKFKAPSSGGVRITTDIAPLGTLDDTKIGLFQVSDSSDYSTFQIIACDDDNGVTDDGYTSTIFSTDLIPNQTYYIEVDGYDQSSTGTFCVQVDEINPTMITNSASCTDLQTPVGNNPDYKGWVTLVDADGYLVANVRNPAGGEANEYSGSYNIDGNGFDTPRQDANGRYYLSRNYVISNSNISTPVDVRFYFQQGEIATLAGVTSNETNLANLNVTKQEDNNCNANFDDANGATSLLMQNANGNVNAVSWIQVSTSSFSNFYLMGGSTPLQISLKTIAAENAGAYNIVKWTTEKIEAGDYFELERGADARHFNFVTKIAANLKSPDYIFNDNNPLQGENFYRLKLVSKDGKSIYSKVVSATVASGKGFDVFAYPNPTRNSVQVKVSGSENGAVTLSDITGRVVYQSMLSGTEATIDLSKVADGVYFIKYTDNNSMTKTIKINKQ